MNLPVSVRDELDTLSLEVFGTKSRWKKLLDRGYTELLTEEVTEYVPGEDGKEGETKKVNVPVKRNGMSVYVTKYHTVESVKETLLKLKEQKEKLQEEIRKMQEEQAKREAEKELAAQVQKEAGGNTLS